MRVVYIGGYGHSGSTLLNIMLGQAPGIMGAGELFRLAGAAWSREEFCSCGVALPRCPTWNGIVDHWTAHVGGDAVARYHRLQRACERWPIPVRENGLWQDYAGHTIGLFTAIRDVTGCATIVDSSKIPARARALAQVSGLDLRLVHLVRDGRGVAWSMRRRMAPDPRAGIQAGKRERSVIRTALMWMWTNLMVERIARALAPERAVRVTYEALAEDPATTLERLGSAIGADLSAVSRMLSQGAPLAPGHVMAGNRLRMHDALRLRPDLEWQARLPEEQRRLVERLCRPVLRRYGYPAAA
ncbi:MAG: sulfotransferase [Geminicoccaceae bacterium]